MEKRKNQTLVKDLTSGNVVQLLLSFAAPLLVANALQAVYNLVDMVTVGQVIGGAGMSAVSIGGDVLHLLTFLVIGFSGAGQVIIAQLVGAGKHVEVEKQIGTMFSFLLVSAIIMAVTCFLLRTEILNLLNTPEESFDYTMDYMVTCIAGLVFIYGYNVVSAILRGMGDAKRPFLFIAIAAVLNTVLDILFVAVMHLEVFGAALATVIGQGVSFIISVVYLYRRRERFGFGFSFRSFRIDPSSLRRLLALGIPMAIQAAAINISKIVLTSWINTEGVIYSALSGIYNKSGMMIGIVSNSFTTAGSSIVGQNIGARKYDRVSRTVAAVGILGAAFAIVISAVVLMFPDAVCEMFTNDTTVLAEASLIIIPIVLNAWGAATRSPAFAIINGSGNSKLNLLVAVLDGMLARVGLAWILGFALEKGCIGFWYGDALAGFMPFMIGSVFYFSGRWKK